MNIVEKLALLDNESLGFSGAPPPLPQAAYD